VAHDQRHIIDDRDLFNDAFEVRVVDHSLTKEPFYLFKRGDVVARIVDDELRRPVFE
jgi:hypothetical protein